MLAFGFEACARILRTDTQYHVEGAGWRRFEAGYNATRVHGFVRDVIAADRTLVWC